MHTWVRIPPLSPTVIIMFEKTHKKLFGHLPLQKFPIALETYTGEPMAVRGQRIVHTWVRIPPLSPNVIIAWMEQLSHLDGAIITSIITAYGCERAEDIARVGSNPTLITKCDNCMDGATQQLKY